MTKADRHRELLESYFDTHAQDWSDLYVRPATANDQVLLDRKDVAVRFLRERVAPGSRVLDAGCGAGLVSRELAEKGFVVRGIDISRKMLDLYERHLSASGVDRSRWSCTSEASWRPTSRRAPSTAFWPSGSSSTKVTSGRPWRASTSCSARAGL